jgi:hypothetical protein
VTRSPTASKLADSVVRIVVSVVFKIAFMLPDSRLKRINTTAGDFVSSRRRDLSFQKWQA